jgi:osmotically-inducible protein OsmY
MSISTIETQLLTDLASDPRIPNPDAIAVDANQGVVTLRGTVGSFAQRRAAVADARKVDGVEDVVDDIDVRLENDDMRADADIRGAALQSLIWDVEIPSGSIDVRVEGGWVFLEGEVSYQFQSDNAFDDVASLTGVTGVTNSIMVVEPLL